MHRYNKVVLALGSNLGDKKNHLINAVHLIHNEIGFVTQASAVYETPSWGFDSFPFYNMCILIHTHLLPQDLLIRLKEVEKKLGREKKTTDSYQARTVDIDIVYFNDLVLNAPDLQIPHPQMQHRKFVLEPLNDLIFDWKHPLLLQTTRELLANCNDSSEIKKVSDIHLPKENYCFQQLNFLAIEGNIGVGKTTLAQKIAQDFNAKTILERFADNPFLPRFYKEPERYAFPLEMSFLADRYTQLHAALGKHDFFNDFVITDYYIYKSLIFAQVTLEPDEALLYRTVFDVMYKEITKPDLYIYLSQNTDNLLANIKKRNRGYEENIQSDYLNNINKSYNEYIGTLPKEKLLIIDVTNIDFVENHKDYLKVLNVINQKIKQ
ncbi:2-amino-4-hydroxy-6-hydroxymethyldihydropteridinediphosphokinase [Paenimyroides aquimaris]|uniref:2-amino-4-hydroxy-6-hydroxymethyldihydropteridine pyrophosphokinase n=1 Tax=Paenimyroides marinum TaxID=1159016 RepID=A0A1H6J2Z7_9FLAO|nr:2-amino-4-hydroxy-6-hydroxymethyldihydropteridine diphosphokinase [Paenimyroides aquimaris]SEH53815.1 2-amino-4-hydroxy-6-hydroxymethyldihydropteridinediphosphokinase [Paenimyroides aquimaris]